MEIKKVLNVTDEEFFSQLKNSLIADIENSTNEEFSQNTLEGFEYNKNISSKLGHMEDVKIVIEAFKEPTHYNAKFYGFQGVNNMEYKITKLDDEKIEVVYTEEFLSSSKAKNINSKIMQFFYKRSSAKRIERLLKAMETYIIQNRKH